MKNPRKLALDSTLLAAILFLFLAPAFAQQEMDPTWFDPWAKAEKPAATKVAAMNADKPRKIRTVAAERPNAKKKFVKVQEPARAETAALVRK
jgi:hypothetical protein